MVVLIDYDAGNIKSVEKAVKFLGEEAIVSKDPKTILSADKVILPGVGSFGEAMNKIKRYELVPVIQEVVQNGTPFLGICLGMQLLFESSEESEGIKGLGILEGQIKKLPTDAGLKIPHIGWNSLDFPNESKLFQGIKENDFVYFVHSYYLEAKDPAIVSATTQYATCIHAAVEKNNVFATQFHPEKSSSVGLNILKNFISINREV